MDAVETIKPPEFSTSFAGIPVNERKPTRLYRAAVWECMLETIYAMNDSGEVRYFNRDWRAAARFSGALVETRRARLWRNHRLRCTTDDSREPIHGQYVVWILKRRKKTKAKRKGARRKQRS
jgi:hypothetical protein